MAWSTGPGTDPFERELFARKDPQRKLQFLGDVTSIQGRDVFGAGRGLFGKGLDVLGQPLSYYQGLLGSRQEALAAAAPDIRTIKGEFQTAAKAVSEFAPRGGGRTAALGELPFREASAIQGLLERVRPQAAEGVTAIGQLLASLGLSEEKLGLAEMGLGAEELESVMKFFLGKKQVTGQVLGDLGKALGAIIQSLITKK